MKRKKHSCACDIRKRSHVYSRHETRKERGCRYFAGTLFVLVLPARLCFCLHRPSLPPPPPFTFLHPPPSWGVVLQEVHVLSLWFLQGQSEGKLSCNGSFGSSRLFWNFQIALFLVFIDFLIVTNYTQQSFSVDADTTYKSRVTSTFLVADVLHTSPAREYSQSAFFPERERPSFAWIRSTRNYGLYVLTLMFLRG
jgi:hypothetical protein